MLSLSPDYHVLLPPTPPQLNTTMFNILFTKTFLGVSWPLIVAHPYFMTQGAHGQDNFK
jgi:hypothetical protein